MQNGQIVTLSFFHFKGIANKCWAFSQMQFARKHMRALPGIGFYKLFGSGSGESFTPWPNFGVYAIMTTWPSLDHAKEQIETATIFQRYRDHSVEHSTIYMNTFQVRGKWDGAVPFATDAAYKGKSAPEPIGVLTRATLKKRTILAFWKRAPAISRRTTKEPDLLFKLGVGEIPWLHQVTFSIWANRAAMVRFAHEGGCHAIAAKDAFEKGWFAESLFARFAVLDASGTWQGQSVRSLISKTPAET